MVPNTFIARQTIDRNKSHADHFVLVNLSLPLLCRSPLLVARARRFVNSQRRQCIRPVFAFGEKRAEEIMSKTPI